MQDYYRVPKYQAGKVIGRFMQKPSKEAIDAVTNFIKDRVEAAGYTKEVVDKIANQTFRKPTEIVNNINYTRPSSFELQQYITDIADQTPQTKAVVEQATSKLPYVKPALTEPTYSQAKAMEQEMTKKIAKRAKRKAARRKAKELAQKAKEQESPVIEEASPVIEEASPVIEEASPVIEEASPVTKETPQKKSIGQKAKELVQKVKGTASKTADETKEKVTKKTNFFKKHPYATVVAGLALSNGTSREGIGNFLNWWTTSPSKQNQNPVPGPVKDTTTVDATIQNAVDAVNQKQQPAKKDSSFRSNQDYNDLFDDEQWLQ